MCFYNLNIVLYNFLISISDESTYITFLIELFKKETGYLNNFLLRSFITKFPLFFSKKLLDF